MWELLEKTFEYQLEILSLNGGYTGSSESAPVEKPYCWKSHVAAHIVFLSFKVNLVLINSADPGEMPQFAAFHVGFRCLPKYPNITARYKKVK